MPIKGYSEARRLPRQGKVKTGAKKTNAKGIEFPVALDHFLVPPEIAAVYGEKPTELDVMFPVNDVEQVFPQYMKKYGKTGLKCKGDGVEGWMSVGGNLVRRRCDPGNDPHCDGCQPRATLSVLLPKIPGFGVWQISTGSWNSIVNINSAIDMLKAMTGGRIAFIPLKLKIGPHEATVLKDDGTQFKKTVYVLSLDITETPGQFYQKFAPKAVPMIEAEEQLQLTGPAVDEENAGEAPPPPPETVQPKEVQPETPQKQNDFSCSDCDAEITSAENAYSRRNFGVPLCRSCQQKRRDSGEQQGIPTSSGLFGEIINDDDIPF